MFHSGGDAGGRVEDDSLGCGAGPDREIGYEYVQYRACRGFYFDLILSKIGNRIDEIILYFAS